MKPQKNFGILSAFAWVSCGDYDISPSFDNRVFIYSIGMSWMEVYKRKKEKNEEEKKEWGSCKGWPTSKKLHLIFQTRQYRSTRDLLFLFWLFSVVLDEIFSLLSRCGFFGSNSRFHFFCHPMPWLPTYIHYNERMSFLTQKMPLPLRNYVKHHQEPADINPHWAQADFDSQCSTDFPFTRILSFRFFHNIYTLKMKYLY